MAYNASGFWESEDDSVATKVAALSAGTSPLMRQATAMGTQAAGRRGLLNSTMAGQAGTAAALGVAVPIASQDASQTFQKNVAAQQRLTGLEAMRTDAGFQADRQATDITAQMDRLRTQAGFDTAARTQQGDITSRLQTQDAAAQMSRLQTQLTSAEGQQRNDIQAQMDRLRTQAGFDTSARAQQGDITSRLNAEQATAEMTRLRTQLASAEGQQRTDIQAQMARLQTQIDADTAGRTQQGQITSTLNAQQAAAEMARLQAQLASADTQQKAEILAQMDRLRTQAGFDASRLDQAAALDLTKLRTQSDLTLQQIQEESRLRQQEAGTNFGYQSQLQKQSEDANLKALAAQADDAMKRLTVDNKNQMDRLLAQGGIEIQRLNATADRSMEELRLNLAASDREKAMASATTMYQASESMLAAIMSNPNIAAGDRAAYQAAVEQRRSFALNLVEQLYNVNINWGGTVVSGGGAPGGPPPAPGGGLTPPGGGGGGGGLLNQPGSGLGGGGADLGMGGISPIDRFDTFPNVTPDASLSPIAAGGMGGGGTADFANSPPVSTFSSPTSIGTGSGLLTQNGTVSPEVLAAIDPMYALRLRQQGSLQ